MGEGGEGGECEGGVKRADEAKPSRREARVAERATEADNAIADDAGRAIEAENNHHPLNRGHVESSPPVVSAWYSENCAPVAQA